jgi:hypothetical protein
MKDPRGALERTEEASQKLNRPGLESFADEVSGLRRSVRSKLGLQVSM